MMRFALKEHKNDLFYQQERKLLVLLQCFPKIAENTEIELPFTNKQQTKELLSTLIASVSQLRSYTINQLELREVLFQEGQSCKERVICLDEYPGILQQMWPCNVDDRKSLKSPVDGIFEMLNNNEYDKKFSLYRFVLRPVFGTISHNKKNRNSFTGYTSKPKNLSDFLSYTKSKDHQDLCNLPELNEKTLLENLKRRLKNKQIYTYIGSILISINPFHYFPIYNPKYVQLYQGKKLHELPPHIFAIADAAYQNMQASKLNQCIVISGESGSGKTENANFLLHHLSALSQKGFYSHGIEKNIAGVGPVLEAFGNAKTIHNDNSSRFGKFVQVSYKEDGTVHGAVVEKYLLEMSRIVSQPENERNYHVFYYLLAGASANLKEKLYLRKPDDFYYLNQQGVSPVPSKGMHKEAKEFERLKSAMYAVGFYQEVQERLYLVLSAILHLGNIQFKKRTESNYFDEYVAVRNMHEVKIVCHLLKVSESALLEALMKRKTMAGGEVVVMSNKLEEVVSTCNTTAKCLYSALFNWIVFQINAILLSRHDAKKHKGMCIGVLDIFGFEDFQTNSFEQFCINYANENLHFYFNQHIFKLEQEEYKKEGIVWRNIEYIDNTACLDLFNKKPSGLLHLLDEESNFPGATNETLLAKFHDSHRRNKYYEVPQLKENIFSIVHYAGKVKYQIKEFREKNIDLMRADVMSMLKNSKCLFVREIIGQNPMATLRWSLLRVVLKACWAFKEAGAQCQRGNGECYKVSQVSFRNPVKRSLDTHRKNRFFKPRIDLVKHMREVKGLQSVASTKLPLTGKNSKSKNKPPSTSAQFHNSLGQLTETLNQATPFFIRCIKSNVQKVAKLFDEEFVQRQLRYTGMLATVKIRQSGYNYRSLFSDFVLCYHILLPKGRESTKEDVEKFLTSLDFNENNFQIGKTKVFLKEYEKLVLDEMLHESLMSRVILLQRWMRARYIRHTFLKIKRAAVVIQTASRGYLTFKRFYVMKNAVLIIQRWYRMAVTRQRYLAFSSVAQNCPKSLLQNRRSCKNRIETSESPISDDVNGSYHILQEEDHPDIIKMKDISLKRNNKSPIMSRKKAVKKEEKSFSSDDLDKFASNNGDDRSIPRKDSYPYNRLFQYNHAKTEIKVEVENYKNNAKIYESKNNAVLVNNYQVVDDISLERSYKVQDNLNHSLQHAKIKTNVNFNSLSNIDQDFNKQDKSLDKYLPRKTCSNDNFVSSNEENLKRLHQSFVHRSKENLTTYISPKLQNSLTTHVKTRNQLFDFKEDLNNNNATNKIDNSKILTYNLCSTNYTPKFSNYKSQTKNNDWKYTARSTEDVCDAPSLENSREKKNQAVNVIPIKIQQKTPVSKVITIPVKHLTKAEAEKQKSFEVNTSCEDISKHSLAKPFNGDDVKNNENKRKNSSVSSQPGPEDIELRVDNIMAKIELEEEGPKTLPWSGTFKEKSLKAPLAIEDAFNDLSEAEEPRTSLDYEVRILSIDEDDDEEDDKDTSVLISQIITQQDTSKEQNNKYMQTKSQSKTPLSSKKKKLKQLVGSDIFHSKDSSDSEIFNFGKKLESHYSDDSKQSVFKHKKHSFKKKIHSNLQQTSTQNQENQTWTVSSTAQWKYPLDLVVENLKQLQQLEQYLSQKVIYTDKLKKERGNKDSIADELFKATLHEFHSYILTQISTAKKATETEYAYSYERLMKMAEEILKAKSRNYETVPDNTVLINPFRGFLDEFMRKKENKELPEIKFKNRHKNKKKQNTFNHLDHQFILIQFSIATFCESCSSKLWVLEKGYTCKICKFTIHKKCASKLTQKCAGVTDDIALAARLGHSLIGCPLNILMQNSPDGYKIHPVIERLMNNIEMEGLYTEGIYRKNGRGSDVKQLISDINSDQDINFNKWGIHVLTSVFKAFFRDMPEPLMTFALYHDFLRTSDIESGIERREALCALVDKMPQVNRDFLERLIFHLAKIALQGASNLMTAENLATIFAPGIMRNPTQLPMQESLLHISRQTACVQFLVEMQMEKTASILQHIQKINHDSIEVSNKLDSLPPCNELPLQEIKTTDKYEESQPANKECLTKELTKLQKIKQELTDGMIGITSSTRSSYIDARLSSEDVDSVNGDEDVYSLATCNSDDTFISSQSTNPSSIPCNFSPFKNNQNSMSYK